MSMSISWWDFSFEGKKMNVIFFCKSLLKIIFKKFVWIYFQNYPQYESGLIIKPTLLKEIFIFPIPKKVFNCVQNINEREREIGVYAENNNYQLLIFIKYLLMTE